MEDIMFDDDPSPTGGNTPAMGTAASTTTAPAPSASAATIPTPASDANSTKHSSNLNANEEGVVTRASVEQYDTLYHDIKFPEITEQNALEYFSWSPFYDRTCNNERVREQHVSLDALKTMTGLEYVVADKSDADKLFIIHKQERSSPDSAVTKAIYYILNREIYQAPNALQICLSRIRSASENILEGIQFLAEHRAFSCVDGRTWRFPDDTNKIWAESTETAKLKKNLERQNFKRVRRLAGAINTAMYLTETTMSKRVKNEDDESKDVHDETADGKRQGQDDNGPDNEPNGKNQ